MPLAARMASNRPRSRSGESNPATSPGGFRHPIPDRRDRARVVRTDVELPDTVTEEELRLHAAEVELRQLRAEVQALRGAIKTSVGVLRPYTPDGR
jgi:hypothetical protein